SRRSKTHHNRKCPRQVRTKMDFSDCLRNTVAKPENRSTGSGNRGRVPENMAGGKSAQRGNGTRASKSAALRHWRSGLSRWQALRVNLPPNPQSDSHATR
ncbi:hypothetical protein, partial [Cognatishimia sp. F0-27]|uniref:hypothetical protein n=1 Tax=Cognatishimia sp. F0-27 TaxID=2816855 RepID=UPI001D0C214E